MSLGALFRFRTGAVIILVCASLMGFFALKSAVRESSVANTSLGKLRIFEAGMSVSTAITDERPLAEAALAAAPNGFFPQLRHLARARQRTDEFLSSFRELASKDLATGTTLNFPFIEAKLRSERHRIDILIATAPAQRKVGEVASALRGMMGVGEAFDIFLTASAKAVSDSDPGLTGQVNIARLLAAFYDAAARLPSEVMPSINARQTIPLEQYAAAERTLQRILAIWDVGGSQLELGNNKAEFAAAIQAIRGDYFGQGLPYMRRVIERQRDKVLPNVSGAIISAIYEPTLVPIGTLRGLYIQQMIEDAAKRQSRAVIDMAVTTLLAGSIVFAVPALTVIGYRQILRPLLEFRNQIAAICERVPRVKVPYTGSVSQVGELYAALETLWDRERERDRLDAERAALSDKLRVLSETDELTGLLNRRGFDAACRALAQDKQHQHGVILIDLDHFKAVNDNFGHHVGDLVLRHFGTVLKTEVPEGIVVARYGGEEFALAVPGRPIESLRKTAETLRKAIEASPLALGKDMEIRVTASFGAASAEADRTDWSGLINKADAALYAAKRKGRNCVVVVGSEGLIPTLKPELDVPERRIA